MECPQCRLLNPPEAQRCDCGWNFETNQVDRSHAVEPQKSNWEGWRFLGYVGIFLLATSVARAIGSVAIGQIAITVALSLAAVVAVAGLVAWFFLRYRPRMAVARLHAMTALSVRNDAIEKDALPEWADLLARCVQREKEARTYCSIVIAKDHRIDFGTEDDHVVACWRIDFAKPNRYHVSQAMRDRELGWLYDEWIAIGEDHYRNSGLWFRTREGHDGVHEGLSLRGVVGAIENLLEVEPTGRAVYRYGKERYLVLDYADPPALGYFDRAEAPGTIDGNFRVWINLRTGFLSKCQLEMHRTVDDREPLDMSVEHAFGCYNERVRVNPPKWLNAVRAEDGKLTIVDVRVPDVRHYGGNAALSPKFTPASDLRGAVLRSRGGE